MSSEDRSSVGWAKWYLRKWSPRGDVDLMAVFLTHSALFASFATGGAIAGTVAYQFTGPSDIPAIVMVLTMILLWLAWFCVIFPWAIEKDGDYDGW